ncbi:DEAD/DEAH box helicase [Actinomycetospora cinnamomea]|nr:DEAD/DEAH box helicase [Actinomycetospora cinnamomea]
MARTIFGPTYCVVEAIHHLLQYLALGDTEDFDAALQLIDQALTSPEGLGDHDARWVASHLRFLADEMGAGSVWSLLPPDLPASAKQAFTLSSPPILALWKPQRELLRPETTNEDGQALDALHENVRRIVLSVPTSAGKTLISQLLTVSFLARSDSSVCYVVPQRSLGREIRRDLNSRLLLLGKSLSRELPEFAASVDQFFREVFGEDEIFPISFDRALGDVSIMTPEGLDQALRRDPDDVLKQYGMFVFDEVHLIKEKSRGFKLESVLSFLHLHTRDTEHKIVLLSAALGNAGQLAAWMSSDGPAKLLESDWRGPRRLHAVFNTDIRWNDYTVQDVPRARGNLSKRLVYDTYGRVRLRPAHGQSQAVETTEPIGQTVFRATAQLERDSSPEGPKSTPSYRMLADIVRHVGQAGPVLVFRSTRAGAVAMANAVGEGLEALQQCEDLAEMAREKLSEKHPLPGLLAKGVAFHHAGLPIDIQEAIEDGLRAGLLNYVTATTTLAEGVNLPVRTVVLAENSYPGQSPETHLTGSRLVNAVGRAGRATKETEGWVILARNAAPTESDFDLFEPAEDDLRVSSVLLEASALEALAVFEEALRAGEDAVLSAHDELAEFTKYVWFILAAQEELTSAERSPDPMTAFAGTLAYRQLDAELRARYESVVEAVTSRYAQLDRESRIRWSRTGAGLQTSRRLDDLARRVADTWSLTDLTSEADPGSVLTFLEEVGVLDAMLDFNECPRTGLQFQSKQGKNGQTFTVSPGDLLAEWVSGASLLGISERLFSRIESETKRIEQAVDTVTDFCEHYFAWMLAALAALVNAHLEADRAEAEFPTNLATLVRYGVRSKHAVELLTSGVHSRDVANSIAEAFEYEGVDPNGTVAWLSAVGIDGWRERFSATNLDARELLEYCRDQDRSILQELLGSGVTSFRLEGWKEAASDGRLELACDDLSSSPAPVVVHEIAGGERRSLGAVPIMRHIEVQALMSAGLEMNLELRGGELSISLMGFRGDVPGDL